MTQMNEQKIVSKLNELDAKESALKQIKADCDKRIEECKVARKGVASCYLRTHRLFNDGEVVRYKDSPRGREFIVKDAMLHRGDNDTLSISYKLETKNGWKPNGGWSVQENLLTLVRKHMFAQNLIMTIDNN